MRRTLLATTAFVELISGACAQQVSGPQPLGLGGAARYDDPRFAISVYPDYCPDKTGVTDCATGIGNWIAAGIAQKKALYIPAGSYRSSTAQNFNIHSIATIGLKISGDGRQLSKIVFDSGVAAPALSFFGNVGTGGDGSGDSLDYGTFRDFSIQGNTAGALWNIGRTDLQDAVNEYVLDNVGVYNGSADPAAVGLRLNYFLNGHVNAVINGGGFNTGTNVGSGLAALECNECQFNMFEGSYSLSGIGGYLTNRFNFGNTFLNIDTEANTTDWVSDSANDVRNTWIGGQISLATNGISFTAGNENTFLSPNFGAPTVPVLNGAGLYFRYSGSNGIGDVNYSLMPYDVNVVTAVTFTAPRTWTLPAASSVGTGQKIIVTDRVGTVGPTNTLTITRAGSDTINGATNLVVSAAYRSVTFESNGANLWTVANPVGTSGAVLGLLNGNLVFSGADQFSTGISVGSPTGGVQSGVANVQLGYNMNGQKIISSTTPTLSGFCTSPTMQSSNGTASFKFSVGTACASGIGTVTLPAATNLWVCDFHDITSPASNIVEQTGATSTSVTVQNYVRTTGVAGNFTSSDVIVAKCIGM